MIMETYPFHSIATLLVSVLVSIHVNTIVAGYIKFVVMYTSDLQYRRYEYIL